MRLLQSASPGVEKFIAQVTGIASHGRKNWWFRPVEGTFSLKEHIYEVLKDAITSMNIYADGAELKLDERELSEQFKISRTPIREALARLEQEGLVTIVPRKGVFITRKSIGEILEMVTVWAALESMAARLATDHATDEELGSLRRMFATFNEDQIEGPDRRVFGDKHQFSFAHSGAVEMHAAQDHRRRAVSAYARHTRPHHERRRPDFPVHGGPHATLSKPSRRVMRTWPSAWCASTP